MAVADASQQGIRGFFEETRDPVRRKVSALATESDLSLWFRGDELKVAQDGVEVLQEHGPLDVGPERCGLRQ